MLVLGWYVLVTSDSVILLTAFGALGFLGTLVSPVFGMLGDRLGRRTMLCFMRAYYAALAAITMTLGMNDALTPYFVLGITFLGPGKVLGPRDAEFIVGGHNAVRASGSGYRSCPHHAGHGAHCRRDCRRRALRRHWNRQYLCRGDGFLRRSLYVFTRCGAVASAGRSSVTLARPEGWFSLYLEHAEAPRIDVAGVPDQLRRLSIHHLAVAILGKEIFHVAEGGLGIWLRPTPGVLSSVPF